MKRVLYVLMLIVAVSVAYYSVNRTTYSFAEGACAPCAAQAASTSTTNNVLKLTSCDIPEQLLPRGISDRCFTGWNDVLWDYSVWLADDPDKRNDRHGWTLFYELTRKLDSEGACYSSARYELDYFCYQNPNCRKCKDWLEAVDNRLTIIKKVYDKYIVPGFPNAGLIKRAPSSAPDKDGIDGETNSPKWQKRKQSKPTRSLFEK